MNTNDPPPSSDPSDLPDPLAAGLRAAFPPASVPHESVLRRLQQRSGSRLGLHVPDAATPSDPPVLITDKAKALRDPAGRYQLLGEIGRGGVGVVYKGRDQDLGRDVAMKVLKDEYAKRGDVLARFVEEAQIGGQLQHPGIVPVYELGLEAGERPYFAMKLVKGETLAAQLARRSDSTHDRRRFLGIFEQVCQTIAYAHSRHVVHRDLKPANVMIGAFGEVQVVDWGFAKVLAQGGIADEAAATSQQASQVSVIATVRSAPGSGSHSVAGSMMGTPAYMPPEQARGDVDRVDERSDVFALGAILCELLTGEPPYRPVDGDLITQAASGELDGAYERLQKSGADAALIQLATDCLARAQRARPASAADVAQRMNGYLTSVEERARQAEVRAAEARLKHRVTLASAAAGLVVVALGAGGWIWIDGQKKARHATAAQTVATARSAASGTRGQAQAAGLDLSLWSTAITSAEQVVALTKGEDVDADARADAETLLAAVQSEAHAAKAEADRRARDAAMVEQLETLRIPTDDDVRDERFRASELTRLDDDYTEAFTTYLQGTALLSLSSEAALAGLREGEIEIDLATSLDHWGLVRDLRASADPAAARGTAHLREIAALLDAGDLWRTQLRALLPTAAREGARLRQLAEQADFAALSAAGCRVLSEALWTAGEKEPALNVLTLGQELHPTDFDLCFRLAIALEQLDTPRWEEAVATQRIAHALRPEHNEVLHRQLMASEELGRYDDEERIVQTLMAREPENWHWVGHLAGLREAQGRPDEAEAAFRRALELDPQRAGTNINLGLIFSRRGEWDDAIACYRRAIELDPRSVAAHVNLAGALIQQGKLDEAIASMERAVDLDPRNATVHFGYGRVFRLLARYDEAAASLKRALEIDPQSADAHAELGRVLYRQGKLDDAIASDQRAIDLAPQRAKSHVHLGMILANRGRFDEASASVKRALEIDPQSAEAHAMFAQVLQHQGKNDDALASAQRALAIDPRLADAHDALGALLFAQGKLDEAAASYRQAIECDPKSPECAGSWFSLAKVFYNMRSLDEAAASARRAIEFDSANGEVHVFLADALRQNGELEQALVEARAGEQLLSANSDQVGRTTARDAHQRVADLEKEVGQIGALDEVLAGQRAAASSEEWIAAINRGYLRKRHREVVNLTETTLLDEPELIDDDGGTYICSCSAALLAASPAPDVSEDERARLRGLAREWLEVLVDRWTAQIGGGSTDSAAARGGLTDALSDTDFTSVRGAAIETLPENERAAWRALWKRIEEGATK